MYVSLMLAPLLSDRLVVAHLAAQHLRADPVINHIIIGCLCSFIMIQQPESGTDQSLLLAVVGELSRLSVERESKTLHYTDFTGSLACLDLTSDSELTLLIIMTAKDRFGVVKLL